MDNLREFEIGLKDFVDKDVPESVRDFTSAVGLEALRGVVLLTPVDTGRLRGNWQVSIGTPAEGSDPDKLDPSGGATIGAGQAVIAQERDPFAPIWLHNGVPYSVFVEDGTEKMTGAHMTAQTVDRIGRRFG